MISGGMAWRSRSSGIEETSSRRDFLERPDGRTRSVDLISRAGVMELQIPKIEEGLRGDGAVV